VLTTEGDGTYEQTNKPNSNTVSNGAFLVLLMNIDVFWAMALCRLVVINASKERIASTFTVVSNGIA
jgi:hypothetical protein